ncbi:3-dehydroquinate synthase [Acidiphilium iwatense]|uniref:Multifunctional fusion protein n=1 Tax=Acidiphilium iwatense TaxID=768198 RepID=A0ABS9DXM5_9PROT|nr:3-dehydroquinate synthase [Acidiphilium iwatense]MCF3947492.1 3-dehydroquinate synthase [Acidiphilium iwatense]
MPGKIDIAPPSQTDASERTSIVLVGLMGAGKSAIGKRLAARLGLPFHDSDLEIEAASDLTVTEIFAKHGEAYFRAGERRVIARLLSGSPIVLATGGGAFMDPETRAVIRTRALSVWLRAPIPILLNRVLGRTHRPLLNEADPETVLTRLSALRSPVYAEADLIVDSTEDPPDMTTDAALAVIQNHAPPRTIRVDLPGAGYDVVVGHNLLSGAGARLAAALPQKRAIVVTDDHVARHHLARFTASLDDAGFTHDTLIIPPGESAKSLGRFASLVEDILALKPERQTAIIALGGGVIGDLAGFAAASVLRGLPFAQTPTSLLAQVDSSVGGKTGINSSHGKNLIGAFHQPRLVVIDTDTLATLPRREAAAGYAEIVKAGLIADAALYDWCEANGAALLAGDRSLAEEAIARAVAFKAAIVAADPREEARQDGRALLNLGHSFAHAFEAETGYGTALLHGEAVAIGLVCAFDLSARLGHCDPALAPRIAAHLARIGLPDAIPGWAAEALLAHMQRDKKMRDGKLAFVLARGIGGAFTSRDVPEDAVRETLRACGSA